MTKIHIHAGRRFWFLLLFAFAAHTRILSLQYTHIHRAQRCRHSDFYFRGDFINISEKYLTLRSCSHFAHIYQNSVPTDVDVYYYCYSCFIFLVAFAALVFSTISFSAIRHGFTLLAQANARLFVRSFADSFESVSARTEHDDQRNKFSTHYYFM